MDKTLLFIVNPRAGKTKSSAPLFDAVATFGRAGYLVRVMLTQAAGDAARFAAQWGGGYDLVVCAGGGAPKVVAQVTAAVKTALDISSAKITVSKISPGAAGH